MQFSHVQPGFPQPGILSIGQICLDLRIRFLISCIVFSKLDAVVLWSFFVVEARTEGSFIALPKGSTCRPSIASISRLRTMSGFCVSVHRFRYLSKFCLSDLAPALFVPSGCNARGKAEGDTRYANERYLDFDIDTEGVCYSPYIHNDPSRCQPWARVSQKPPSTLMPHAFLIA